MNYHLLKSGDEKLNLAVTLTMAEVKILHNACVDILKEYPEMVSYKSAMEVLDEIIVYQQNKLNPHE